MSEPSASTAPGGPLPDEKHIADFARVQGWLWRGDEPDKAGFEWLQAHGAKIVVNLRMKDEEKEIHDAAPALLYIHIGVKNDMPPSDDQAIQWLELCKRCKAEQIIYVHCREGHGRTSTFCALVRIAQGWSADAAIHDQLPFGFRPDEQHKLQAEYLRDFARRKQAGLLKVPAL